MSKWLKEPLLHFLVLGGLIFVVYGKVSEQRSEQEIFISAGQQDTLINTFTRTWQRPPTADEFKGLLDDYVREEIAYREASAMGLDDNDVIIRRRLRQKLELLAEDVAALEVPSEAELQSFLQSHQDDYLIDARYTLRQLYFSPDQREDAAADAEAARTQLQAGGQDSSQEGSSALPGDSISLPTLMNNIRTGELGRLFGAAFATRLENIATGSWQGPIESGFGQHLVFIIDKTPAQVPQLDQVRDEVQRDWFSQQRHAAVDGLYRRLAENYEVEIESFSGSVEADAASTGAEAGAQ